MSEEYLSPRVVVALADVGLRAGLVRALCDDGFLVTSADTTLRATVSLADELLDDRLTRPQCIVLGDAPDPRLARSLAAGLRDLGWTTPIVFAVAGRALASPFADIAEPKREVAEPTVEALRDAVWSVTTRGGDSALWRPRVRPRLV